MNPSDPPSPMPSRSPSHEPHPAGRTDAFPLSRWFTPEVQSFGREPITSALPSRRDLADARTDGSSPWVVSLDGPWNFRLVETPDHVTAEMTVESATAWDTMTVPSSWVFAPGLNDGRHGSPIYLNFRKASIYGGSNEVQRQIIARTILGL